MLRVVVSVAMVGAVGACGRVGFDATGDGGGSAVAACVGAGAHGTPATAEPVALGDLLGGTICAGEQHVYAITLSAGDELAVTVATGGPGWLSLAIDDAAGVARAVKSYDPVVAGFADHDGTYEVTLGGAAATAGTPYQISFALRTGTHYFVAPAGDDAAAGTFAAPWMHLDVAADRLDAGDTLVLLDGTYPNAQNDQLRIDCTAGAKSGTAAAPIRVVALTERKAFIQSDGTQGAIYVNGCSYWTLDGLHVESADNVTAGGGQCITLEASTSNVTVRRGLFAHNNRYFNSALIDLSGASDTLIEESELYEFSGNGLVAYGAPRTTVRRTYANSRLYPDIAGGYGTTVTDRGDNGIGISHSPDSTAENTVEENNAYPEVSSAGGVDSTNVRWLGGVAYQDNIGLVGSVDTGSQNTIDSMVVDYASVASHQLGIYVRSNMGFQCTRCTAVGTAATGDGWIADQEAAEPRVSSSSCTDCLAIGDGSTTTGYYVTQQTGGWSLDHVDAFANSANFSPAGDPSITAPLQIDPQLGGCTVYLPASSPLVGAGATGGDVGAQIKYRYQDGTLTGQPLWDPLDGSFPCGAVVAGVNDDPATSCTGIHQRLHVGAADCPLPYPAL